MSVIAPQVKKCHNEFVVDLQLDIALLMCRNSKYSWIMIMVSDLYVLFGKWLFTYMTYSCSLNPALSRVILHLSMPKGGVKLPPKDFSLYLPNGWTDLDE